MHLSRPWSKSDGPKLTALASLDGRVSGFGRAGGTDVAPDRSLMEYPSTFPIKVMGEQVAGFVDAIVAVVLQFDSAFDATTVELRPSKAGKYLGVTLTVMATSREQLDELYRTLSTHPMVKVVL